MLLDVEQKLDCVAGIEEMSVCQEPPNLRRHVRARQLRRVPLARWMN